MARIANRGIEVGRRGNWLTGGASYTALALRLAAAAAGCAIVPDTAYAACTVTGTDVACDPTATTDTTYSAGQPNDRSYDFNTADATSITVSGAITGNGIALANSGSGTAAIVNAGSVTVDAGNFPQSGGGAAVALNGSGGSLYYLGSGSVTNLGTGAGIGVVNGGPGSISVLVGGSITTAIGTGIQIDNSGGGGDTLVEVAGTIDTNGPGITVSHGAGSGNITITAHDVNATSSGIFAFSQSTNGDITISALGTVKAGAQSAGIGAQIFDAVDTGDIAIYAYDTVEGTVGISGTNFGIGDIVIDARGAVTGVGDNGIYALASKGNIIVDATTLTSTGGAGIYAEANDAASTGNVTVHAHGSIDALTGIRAVSQQGYLDIASEGAIVASDDVGIDALTQHGAITISSAGPITAKTTGIFAQIQQSDATSDIAIASTGAIEAATGIVADNAGSGAITINTSGPLIASLNDGVVATTAGGDITVDLGSVDAANGRAVFVTQAQANAAGVINVTAHGDLSGSGGIAAKNQSGDVNVTVGGSITSSVLDGIYAFSAGGRITVTQAAGSVIDGGQGGVAMLAGTLGNQASIAGVVQGRDGSAIYQLSVNGANATVVEASGNLTGYRYGVEQINEAGANIVENRGLIVGSDGVVTGTTAGNTTIANDGVIEGLVGAGVRVNTESGDVTVAGTGQIRAVQQALLINGGGNITLTGQQDFISETETAVDIYRSGLGGGDITIATDGGLISGASGIAAQSVDTGTIAISSKGTVIGTSGYGIIATQSGAGAIDITADGAISGGITGISANAKASNVAVTINGAVAGGSDYGINVAILGQTDTGAGITITQNAGAQITSQGLAAIATNSGKSSGATSITIGGEVMAPGNTGIAAVSTSGDISVDVLATGKVDPLVGIDLATVDGALSISNGGLVEGDVAGIQLSVTGTGSVTVTNTGTVYGGEYALVGLLSGGAFVLDNQAGGIIDGAVALTGSDLATSTFANAGTWYARGNSIVSASWDNSGVTYAADGALIRAFGGSTNSGTISFSGAALLDTPTLVNTGMMDARNGVAGNNTVFVNGNYVGGGELGADFNTATATADAFVIAGTATGSTNVRLNRTGTGVLPTGFLPIITVAAGGNDDVFTSDTPLTTIGFLLESFARNPDDQTQWGILQSVNPVSGGLAGGLGAVDHIATGLFDEPISLFVDAKADPAPNAHQFGLWGRGGAGTNDQDVRATVTSDQTSVTFEDRLRTEGQGLQLGADFGLLNLGGKGLDLHFGVTGGAIDGTAKQTGVQVGLHSTFVGGYVFLTKGSLTLDGVVRHEWRRYDLSAPLLFGNSDAQRVGGDATIGQIDASYRIGGGRGFALTPHVRYMFGGSNVDAIVFDGGVTYQPDNPGKSVGEAGARLSYRFQPTGNFIAEPFFDATAVHDWSASSGGTVIFASTPDARFSVDSYAYSNAMRYSAGFVARDAGGRLAMFATGSYTDGSRVSAMNFTIGARYNF